MLTIIDYASGNLGSISNMLKRIGVSARISSDPDEILKANKLILLGVGTFNNGITNLEKMGIINNLSQRVLKNKVPILGICLGMQLLGKKSEEGRRNGLGLINAETIQFKFDNEHSNLRIPHMGWNNVDIVRENLLFEGMDLDLRFYFAHSYYVKCADPAIILTQTNYGLDFVSAFQKENILGVQFHPEKSHKFGMALLKNFVEKF